MKHFQDTLVGTLIIATLVAAGVWFAHEPDGKRWPLAYFPGSSTATDLPQSAINRIDWSADSQKLLTLFRGPETAEGCLALHDVKVTGRLPIETVGFAWATVALAPDACHVAAGTHDGCLWWIKLDSCDPPTLLVDVHFPTDFSATAIANDSRLVAGGTNLGSIYLCTPSHRTWITLETGRRSRIRDLHFSSDGTRLIAAQADGRATVWNVTTGERLQEFSGHGQEMTAAEFLSDGERIITAGHDGSVRIWEIASGRELWRGEFGQLGINTLAVSHDGSLAAWGGYDRRIIVWDLQQGRKKFQIATSAPAIFHLRFSPDGTKLAAAGWEGTLRFYDVRTAAEAMKIEVASPEWM